MSAAGCEGLRCSASSQSTRNRRRVAVDVTNLAGEEREMMLPTGEMQHRATPAPEVKDDR
jgi:hypothetical protein